MKNFNATLTIAILGLCSAVAQGRPGTETTSSVLRLADLNLQSANGIARLHARIHTAARAVCGNADNRNLHAVSHARACMAHAVARAIASIDARAPRSLALRPSLAQ